jgi:transcription termination/antitermination protein NusG
MSERLAEERPWKEERRWKEDPNGCPVGAGAPAWYAVWTRSHCERLVAHQLSAKSFSAFLPEINMRSKRSGWSRPVLAPIFPGYLFVRHAMDKTSYRQIIQARGVVRILEGWTRLSPIPDSEVEAIRRLIDAGLEMYPHPYLRQGDRVRVIEGPLAGLEGVFVRENLNRGRLVLSIDLIRSSIAVELDRTFVEGAAPSPRLVS